MEFNDAIDASSIDSMDEYDLTGEIEELVEAPNPPENNEDNDDLPHDEDNNHLEDEPDFTTEVLRLKGIKDPNKIKFEDESGAVVERSWDDLSRNEQLRILTQEGDPETDLDDEEWDLINEMRLANLSPKEYINSLVQLATDQIQQNQPRVYDIDSLSDDELFVLDLIEKVGDDVSDEEIKESLEAAKQNEALYNKTVTALRQHYRNLEDEDLVRTQALQEQEAEERYQNFSTSVLQQIEGLNEIGGMPIELSFDDMNDLANFILTRDESGVSQFGAMLNNPKAFTTIALWALKGQDMLNDLLNEIQKAYTRGYNTGKGITKTTPKFTIQKPSPSKDDDKVANLRNAFAAFGDDESYLN